MRRRRGKEEEDEEEEEMSFGNLIDNKKDIDCFSSVLPIFDSLAPFSYSTHDLLVQFIHI